MGKDGKGQRRSHPRATTDIAVELRLKDRTRVTSGRIRNASLGGVFVELEQPLPFGTDVTLKFNLQGEPRPIHCEGFVVWSTDEQPSDRSGSGIRLTNISVRDMRRLAEFIKKQLDKAKPRRRARGDGQAA